MRYAILSDVHGYRYKLEAVLADARARAVDQVISLGDVGGDDCLALLRQVGALAVFGNYEVSGWPRLQPEHRAWVRSWSPLLIADDFLAAHAVPWSPLGLGSVVDFGAWLKRTGRSWRTLFPYLNEHDELLWRALAELEDWRKALLFHGHTHRQAVWRRSPGGRLVVVAGRQVPVQAGCRYLVGVGSVGLPEDGAWASYTLYDSSQQTITQIHLTPI